ncbi:MAG: hypothetical protein E6040_09885 [Lachnospiraceae bacterium]|nr:hypothetical protein [Lachnospiraceae bacterium]
MGRMLDIANKEVARQFILEILEEASITGCSIQVLRQVLNKNGIEADSDSVLFYLESKGLVRSQCFENKRQDIKRVVYFITDKGIDYLDGNVKEVGLADG